MSEYQSYMSAEFTTRTYYIISDTFQRPIEFKLAATYNSPTKAKEAFQNAFYPCKVKEFIEPREGMSYMASTDLFDESGVKIKGQ